MSIINVNISNINQSVKIEKGTSLEELAEKYKDMFSEQPLLAAVDNEIMELRSKIIKDCGIEFLDINNSYGYYAYQRGIVYLMIYSFKKVLGDSIKVNIKHSVNQNYYCTVDGGFIDDETIKKVEEYMKELVKENIPIERVSVTVSDGLSLYRNCTDTDMSDELKYTHSTNITMHKMKDFYDYMYGDMVISTGVLKTFGLVYKNDNAFVIRFPLKNGKLNEVLYYEKLMKIFEESLNWAKVLNVGSVKYLNNMICDGKIRDIICLSEAFHEKKLAQISDMITGGRKRVILIAGPSSSGKTTFANRLCIQLRVNGIKPHIISLDNYYFDRGGTPVDEFGKPDYECLESIDVKQINEDINLLLKGETVQIPEYNFFKGCREYKGNFIKLDSDDVLVIEGIHGLNEKLTKEVPKECKFKIYISALTQININPHNRITTTDTRLIRRMVRDSQFRGFDAVSTIDMWPSVLRGERKYIFPFQEEADIMFNSALVYELAVLKPFVEPLLFKIDKSQLAYREAKRLIKFMNSFLSINDKYIPQNSIIREFIGGGCFE
ncbi:MAG: nucleoside kinase [Clostridiales bacterium]|nr:nucleoside kinase [Clostridiales bacterium]